MARPRVHGGGAGDDAQGDDLERGEPLPSGQRFWPEDEGDLHREARRARSNDQRAAPHALALQEVGDPKAIDDLVNRLDGNWHQRVSQNEDGRGIRVAWLSPLDIIDSDEIVAFPPPLASVQSDDKGGVETEMGRGALAITINSDEGQPVRLATAHFHQPVP